MANNSDADLHVGIFGPGLSGKTTLAKNLSRSYWHKHTIKSLAFDIHMEDWGKQCWVTNDEEKFLSMVWREKNCAVFMDESSDTIDREKGKTPLFTRIRHNGHKLHVCGHGGESLLPTQRRQLQTLFLFRQEEDSAKLWAKMFSDKRIYDSQNLNRFEFLWCRYWEKGENRILRRRLTL